MKRALALAIVLIAAFTAVGMLASVGASTAGPSGMVGVPSDNIGSDLPPQTPMGQTAEEIESGGVYASDHAGSLEVIVTNPGRAKNQYSGGNIQGSGPIAIVFADDVEHEGREVALDMQVLEEAIGHQPSAVFGAHEDGDEWSREVRTEDGYAIFEIPHFSENTVTFSGGIELSGTEAGDGTTYEYELGDLDGIDNFEIELTGTSQSENLTSSGDTSSPSELTVGGNTDPTNETLTVTPGDQAYSEFHNNVPGGTFTMSPGEIEAFELTIDDLHDPDGFDNQLSYVRIAISQDAPTYDDLDSGEIEIWAGDSSDFANPEDVVDDGTYLGSQDDNWWRVGSGVIDSDMDLPIYIAARSVDFDSSNDLNWRDDNEAEVRALPEPASVTVGGQTVETDHGEETASINLVDGSNDMHTEGPGSWEVSYTAHTLSEDPIVGVNGYETQYSGILADGETTSLATNEAWIQEGTNTVTVTTNSPTTGPESLVGFTYAHDASGTMQSADVSATSWTETFNVSNTFPSETNGAEATLTFVDSVAEINEVEYRVNGGEWGTPADTSLNGTDLMVQFGDVAADTTIEVRATGHKVRSFAGDFTVTQPTVEGDELSTQIEVTDLDEEGRFGIGVGGTYQGDRIHYATEASWSDAEPYAETTAGGDQFLWAPGANVGSTMWVETAPISVTPESGAIETRIDDVDEPRFSLREGDTVGASTIDIAYHDTIAGERYVLWSISDELEVDADRASSPVYFTTDGSSTTYSIIQRALSGGGAEAQESGPTDTETTIPLILVVSAIGIVLVGTAFVGRRFGLAGWLLPVVAGSITALAIEVLAPGSPLGRAAMYAIESNIASVFAVALGLLAVWFVNERTHAEIPILVRGAIAAALVLYLIETLAPGTILGGIATGVETTAPILILIGVYFIWQWWSARREAQTTPENVIQITGGEDD